MKSKDITLLTPGTAVRVVKLAAADDAGYRTCSWKEWRSGEPNDGSPPVDYELRGLLLEVLGIGKSIIVLRADPMKDGSHKLFVSTPIREIKHGAAITMNSIYFISKDEATIHTMPDL